MNAALVDKIVDAVLYEGYILYPYRPSVKNRQRWTFGGLFPRDYSMGQESGDAWTMQTECLLHGGENSIIQVHVRFLHLLARLVGQLDVPLSDLSRVSEPDFRVVENLQVGNRLLQTWQEAVQREIVPAGLEMSSLVDRPRQEHFAFPGDRQIEPVRGPTGQIEALLVREQEAVRGLVEVSAQPVGKGLFKLSVRVENHTPLENVDKLHRERALLQSLASTHTILGVEKGEFLSSIDPPDDCRLQAAACRNEGTFPVLVGDSGSKDAMLSSPITLYDYPQIAAESPGDFFDGTEIDEMLVLRIMTLTDEEKLAAAAVDERARALLARTALMSPEQKSGLHGKVRGMHMVSAENVD